MQKPEKKGSAKIKSQAARDRKKAESLKREAKEKHEKEDKYWQEAEQGTKSPSTMKREENALKRAEATARKAETRRFLEEEEKELEEYSLKKKKGKTVAKVTEAELIRRRVEEKAAIRERVEEIRRRRSRITAEEEYEATVLVKNTNRDNSVVEASTIEEAIAQMTIKARPEASRRAFEKAEILRLKEKRPGLRNDQYEDMAMKLWKRSHLNPVNHTTDAWKKAVEILGS